MCIILLATQKMINNIHFCIYKSEDVAVSTFKCLQTRVYFMRATVNSLEYVARNVLLQRI
jgi:hypothetical protein